MYSQAKEFLIIIDKRKKIAWTHIQWFQSNRHLTMTFVISAFQMYVLYFGHFFSKTGKTRVSHRVKMMTRWPGCERWPKWPTDPVTQWPSSMSVSHSKSHLKNLGCLLSWQSIEVIEFAAIRCRLYRPITSNHSSLVTTSLLRTVSDILPYSQWTQLPDDARDLQVL